MTKVTTQIELSTMLKRAETVKQAQKEASTLGWTILEAKFFDHDADSHLVQLSVLRNEPFKPYATVEYNAQSNAFYWGHYDIATLEAVREDLEQR